MEKRIITIKNEDLLREICECYGYYIHIVDGKVFCIMDGADIQDEETYTYRSITEGLIDWLPTLEASEKEYKDSGAECSWENEIEYIKSLI